jgi:hypothetical protein
MASVASQPPMRVYSGFTQDGVYQPMHNIGQPNPFFYHSFSDDFDQNDVVLTNNNTYLLTQATGSSALVNVSGGAILQSTTAAANDFVEAQVVRSSFTVNIAPKKLLFIARVQLNAITTVNFITGLVSQNVTPFTSIADGVYFKFVAGTGLTINSTVGGVTTSATIPAAAYTLAAATNIDLAFEISRKGDILAWVDTQLVGFVPQSNYGTPGNPQNPGAVARVTGPTLTTAVLAPLFAVQATAAAIRTAQWDFIGAYQER